MPFRTSARSDLSRDTTDADILGRMTPSRFMTIVSGSALVLACAARPSSRDADTTAGIDSLNARVVQAYRTHDPEAYAALYTDTATFEWPAFNTVRGRPALQAMARSNWAALRDMNLRLDVAIRRLAPDHATELGSFQQSWSDSTGVRHTEFGRYATILVRGKDGRWLMDRFLGFEDSTRTSPR